MNKFILVSLLFLAGCAPPINYNPPPVETPEVAIVNENAGSDIVIYHDDKRGVTCYTITNTIITHYASYGQGVDTNHTKSLSCVADSLLVKEN